MLNVPCKNLFNFAVRHDGRVRLCGCRLTQNDNDDLVVGNLREKSLAELSGSDEAWQKILGFYSGKRPETCKECTFYQPITRHWFERRLKEGDARPLGDKVPGTPTPLAADEPTPPRDVVAARSAAATR
jgi:radical SAM protein with 4Fe4S-binding SPASM domain